MERREPTLVPEWLKNAGSNGGGSTSNSDDHPTSKLARNKLFANTNGHDFGRTNITTSSYFRRSSSTNGSGHLRSYNSFNRTQRSRDYEKDTFDSWENDKPVFVDGLRRSNSMISRRNVDTWPQKGAIESSSTNGSLHKATFERNFPSLSIVEERTAILEVGRVPSPGLGSAVQSLQIGPSAKIGGEKWTSALAEAPLSVSVQPVSLNMAEAVAQGPNRGPVTPQLSVETQRLEELAIKQSRQLIPVTPSLPKALVLSSSDKQKIKVNHHPLQHNIASSLPVNHSPRFVPAKNNDISKTFNVGKLQILKPVREKNGVTPIMKGNNLSPTNGGKVVNSTLSGPPINPVLDRKPAPSVPEKRPNTQARSRNDFFNLVRKKSMSNNTSSGTDSAIENSIAESEVVPATSTARDCEGVLDLCPSGDFLTCNGKRSSSNSRFSEEEESVFLRSLGWEEDSDEGGLTDEEINGFFRDLAKKNSKMALEIFRRLQPKLPCSLLESLAFLLD